MVLLYNAGLILGGPSPIFLQGKSQTFSNGGFTQLNSSMYKKILNKLIKHRLMLYIFIFFVFDIALVPGQQEGHMTCKN